MSDPDFVSNGSGKSRYSNLQTIASWLFVALFLLWAVNRGTYDWEHKAGKAIFFLGIVLFANVSVGVSTKGWFRNVLDSKRNAVCFLFATSVCLSGADSAEVLDWKHILFFSLVVPSFICLVVFLFEGIVKRPPFVPWHRLVLAVLCLPVLNGILNAF